MTSADTATPALRPTEADVSVDALSVRVHATLEGYEALLRVKHGGRSVRAARTRRMLATYGPRETVRRIVGRPGTASCLDVLAAHGRLDLAYEHIVIDLADAFADAGLVAKAWDNLRRVDG